MKRTILIYLLLIGLVASSASPVFLHGRGPSDFKPVITSGSIEYKLLDLKSWRNPITLGDSGTQHRAGGSSAPVQHYSQIQIEAPGKFTSSPGSSNLGSRTCYQGASCESKLFNRSQAGARNLVVHGASCDNEIILRFGRRAGFNISPAIWHQIGFNISQSGAYAYYDRPILKLPNLYSTGDITYLVRTSRAYSVANLNTKRKHVAFHNNSATPRADALLRYSNIAPRFFFFLNLKSCYSCVTNHVLARRYHRQQANKFLYYFRWHDAIGSMLGASCESRGKYTSNWRSYVPIRIT